MQKRMRDLWKRRIGTGLCAAAFVLLLNGCAVRELEDREFVQAMEIDWNGEQLTGGFGQFLVEADTVDEIQREYQNRIDKYLDLGHVKVLILGEALMQEQEKLQQVLRELEEKPILARNILVLSYDYESGESCLKKMEEKGIAPGEYISNLYKNNPYKKQNPTATLGELLSETV